MQIVNNLATVNELQLATNFVSLGGKGSATIHSSPHAPREGSISRSEMPTMGDVEMSGQINLAEIARQLPGTLRLRPDTQLQSGVAEISLASQSTADGRRWTGSLNRATWAASQPGGHCSLISRCR